MSENIYYNAARRQNCGSALVTKNGKLWKLYQCVMDGGARSIEYQPYVDGDEIRFWHAMVQTVLCSRIWWKLAMRRCENNFGNKIIIIGWTKRIDNLWCALDFRNYLMLPFVFFFRKFIYYTVNVRMLARIRNWISNQNSYYILVGYGKSLYVVAVI